MRMIPEPCDERSILLRLAKSTPVTLRKDDDTLRRSTPCSRQNSLQKQQPSHGCQGLRSSGQRSRDERISVACGVQLAACDTAISIKNSKRGFTAAVNCKLARSCGDEANQSGHALNIKTESDVIFGGQYLPWLAVHR